MVRFVYIVVLIAVASLSYCKAEDFETAQDERQEECKGGPHDVWESETSPCEKTCSHRYIGLCSLLTSSGGCRCQFGTLRNAIGLCVPPYGCSENDKDDYDYDHNHDNNTNFEIKPVCKGGRYDEWLESFTTYEPNCEEPYIGFAPLGNVERGCRCVAGTVRRMDGFCNYLGTCPGRKLSAGATENEKKCLGGPNDQWVNNIHAYERRCENPDIGVPILIDTRTGGCRCGNGSLRRNDGVCVSPSSCSLYAINKPTHDRIIVQPSIELLPPFP